MCELAWADTDAPAGCDLVMDAAVDVVPSLVLEAFEPDYTISE